MKRILYFGYVIAAIGLVSCSNSVEAPEETAVQQYAQIKKIGWLVGSWRGTSPEGVFGETWQMRNDSILSGKGYFVVGKDTVSMEALRLVQEGNKLYYEPTVNNQNNGKAVRFELTSMSDTTMIFENAAHDFPQKICYRLINADSLVAEISGQSNGEARSELFPLSRMK